jgi:hypothetical protein
MLMTVAELLLRATEDGETAVTRSVLTVTVGATPFAHDEKPALPTRSATGLTPPVI